MKYLKLYENFEDIEQICQKYRIKNYTINKDGSIDVYGEVDLTGKCSHKLPLKFNKIEEGFFCGKNSLISLEGCPKEVCGDFSCYNNNLTTLEYGPKIVK